MAPQDDYRIEKDSMGELQVPTNALWGAQSQRAVDNFPISDLRAPRAMINALGLIKAAAAEVNRDLGLLDADIAQAIIDSAKAVAEGQYDDHFPVDIFQTGSGTSSNMNTNEVVAHLATKAAGQTVHPNDHVNMGQSSNDVIPTAIHVAAVIEGERKLLPALTHMRDTLRKKGDELSDLVKTGRTHLMDAMPVRFDQELGGWAAQIDSGIARVESALVRLRHLAQGGTAVGTGINAHPEFGERFAKAIGTASGCRFEPSSNYFESLSSQDAAVELSGQLKTVAVSMMKIANDLRWMNSGPLAGLGEIQLEALQPGSSIMPGKVNPVIPEAAAMVSAQVIGNDSTITVAGQSGNFQLNVMLPVIAYNLLQSIELLANTSQVMADKAIASFTVNQDNLNDALSKNPILVTALNSVIGYDKGAAIAKQAYKEGKPIKELTLEQTDLSEEEVDRLLDPADLTKGGIKK
ncbi:aspartate ammonia-lyase [Salinisphaera sp.]|uniref:class II fumarate hydratase n=1 Tax=Salinisphaera sp. TaxID=1914330 RepID=UPI000C681662|nr:class II fumarate hydratase [Salinisphaera sp.]MAS09570.1 aspartate ammonia-lyase [Salinisphaera sp.]|tara:strand:+ start:330 stop:1721 length:1392 start_codon:yes stop_codon:yes gene_type:complete